MTAIVVARTSAGQRWSIAGGLPAGALRALLVWPAHAFGVAPLAPDANTAFWIDRAVFGTHLLTPSGDPEGLFGVLTSVSTALFGAAAGRWLAGSAQLPARSTNHGRHVPGRWPSPASSASRLRVCVWSFALPLNKPLWTASFAVFTSGAATLALAALAALDVRHSAILLAPLIGWAPIHWRFTRCPEFASNLMQRAWLAIWPCRRAERPHLLNGLVPLRRLGGPRSSLAYAAGYVAVWIAVAGVMRWRGVRIRA